MIKSILAALALTTALSFSAADAMAKPVTFSTTIKNYGGNNAYLAMTARTRTAPSALPRSSSKDRSGWGMSPSTLPLGLVMPAMPRAEPLGLSR